MNQETVNKANNLLASEKWCSDVITHIYIHTVHEGLQHFWTRKMYEKSEETKRLERMFMECMRKDGLINV